MLIRESLILKKKYRAFLFDMDGTLINSIILADRVWGKWAREQGLDVETFLPTIHGARSVDTIANLKIPGLDPVVEANKITQAEILDLDGILEIGGAVKFLNSLPPDKWAVVTSAPLALATARLRAAGIPIPAVLITAEDVSKGKPSPDCYLLAAQKLGVVITDCLVFEDAPIGIQAGEASGADVVVITDTHTKLMNTRHTTIPNYGVLRARVDGDGFILLSE